MAMPLVRGCEVSYELHPGIAASNEQTTKPLFDIMNRKFLTTDEAAEIARVTRFGVYEWRRKPKVYHVPDGLFIKSGRILLIDREVFLKWLTTRHLNR